MQLSAPTTSTAFEAEVQRLRQDNVLGASGRLRDLFDYLADRGSEAGPATQAEIAEHVFGQAAPEADDATVRVYVHRLRKRLEEHYANGAPPRGARLEIPAGIYALRIVPGEGAEDAPLPPPPPPAADVRPRRLHRTWPLLVAALLVAFAVGWLASSARAPAVNAIWQPFLESERPILIVLGDYYIYGEIDPVQPEEGRLIRDFRVNSAEDLEMMQGLDPERFGGAEDVGLNYLPFSSAYAMRAIVPVLERSDKAVRILPASALEPDMLNQYDIVYIGLLSGMGLLEEFSFMNSGFRLGESYDELIDTASGQRFVSEEARSLTSPAYYTDYAYVARFTAQSGALVAIVGGARDTGLRGLSPIVALEELPDALAGPAQEESFEALYRITGQQGADLSERLVLARPRSGAMR
jgi:hypothetical protein